MASRAIANLAVSVTARTKGLRRGLKNAGKDVRAFASKLADVGSFAIKGAGIAGTAVAGGTALAGRSLDKLLKQSDKLGIAPNALRALRDAGEESGIEINVLDMALQRMLRRVQEASKGKGEAIGALGTLGLDAERLNKLAPEQQILKVAKAMGTAEAQMQELALAQKLFDSEGVVMVNLLKTLRDKGLKGYQDALVETGRDVQRHQLEPIAAVIDHLGRLGDRISGVFDQLAIAAAPEVLKMLDRLELLLQANTGPILQFFSDLPGAARKVSAELEGIIQKWDSVFSVQPLLDFFQDAMRIVKAIGLVFGGLGATIQQDVTGIGRALGDPVGTIKKMFSGESKEPSGPSPLDMALEDATRMLGDIPDRIRETANSGMESASQAFDKAMKFADEGAAAASDALLKESSKQTDLLRQIKDVGFGTNPATLPPGTMIIKVSG